MGPVGAAAGAARVSLLRAAFSRRDAPPGSYPDPSAIPSYGSGALVASDAGVNVTERNALMLSAFWACVDLLQGTMGALPAGAFRTRDGARYQMNPSPALLEEPSADIDWAEWMGSMMISLLMRGNAYALVAARDRLQYPTDLYPVHPDTVMPYRERLTGDIKYRVAGDTYTPYDVFHLKGMKLAGGIVGLSPLEFARQSIGLGLAVQQFGSRTFSEGTHPPGVLETEQELSSTAAKLALRGWEKDHNNRSRRPAVLSGGLHWKPISISPEESQFLGTRGFQVVDVARFMGRIPPHMILEVDKTTSWGKGVEEQSFGFVTYSLLPWVVKFERALSRCLPKPQFVKFNLGGLLRGRLLERYQAYLWGRNGGWLTSDEIRRLEDMAPLPNGIGDTVMQPLNTGILTPQGVMGPIPGGPIPPDAEEVLPADEEPGGDDGGSDDEGPG